MGLRVTNIETDSTSTTYIQEISNPVWGFVKDEPAGFFNFTPMSLPNSGKLLPSGHLQIVSLKISIIRKVFFGGLFLFFLFTLFLYFLLVVINLYL